ncbi:hypothetical protein K435DRAFT_851923 [Dendrothele bispora CBS 962.96]|uniref:FAD/NAD(P)-binding domain-containing protein n=1 Tax=Dendrothele bispora (strain CBS 962.96) TaxID=1314807 RepID=A0A4S8MKV0_DENBC|nr:hypothetical protein K435DRAFT_851923 [Dendrothele bispora CBS 962.96]
MCTVGLFRHHSYDILYLDNDNSTNFSIQTISSSNAHFFKSSIIHRFSVFPVTALSSKFSFPTFNSRPGDHDTATGSTMSPLTSRKVDESSKMHSRVVSYYSIIPTTWVIIGSQSAICLAHANVNLVPFGGFMGNGFTATVNARKRLGLRGEEAYWQSGISTFVVCDGAVPISRNKPLAVIGGGDSGAEVATLYIVFLTGLIHFLVHLAYLLGHVAINNPFPHSSSALLPLTLLPATV